MEGQENHDKLDYFVHRSEVDSPPWNYDTDNAE